MPRLLPAPAGMVPGSTPATACAPPAPRARGDGPGTQRYQKPPNDCSPRPRGWSRVPGRTEVHQVLLPAPAGMVPRTTSPHRSCRAPRARGDGPWVAAGRIPVHSCSPRPRGWSPPGTARNTSQPLLPAPAGMVRGDRCPRAVLPAAPRARGDGPWPLASSSSWMSCSPRPRGWSHRVAVGRSGYDLLPAPAGMVPTAGARSTCRSPAPRARGDGPDRRGFEETAQNCSPRPRGWSSDPAVRRAQGQLLPAPAGMVPPPQRAPLPPPRLLPAPAGMVPRAPARRSGADPAPLARGDGPSHTRDVAPSLVCSPRPRGWSPTPEEWRELLALLPAPAGMVPRAARARSAPGSAPRARGDGPEVWEARPKWMNCSPRPRGWSPAARRRARALPLLPAPAGMIPFASATAVADSSAPRARGDGPRQDQRPGQLVHCSPRPRGWSLLNLPADLHCLLLPAPAGSPSSISRPISIASCSPRPRGWSLGDARHHLPVRLLPAPAGMVPRREGSGESEGAAPRARGDGPLPGSVNDSATVCSPRPRGWSLVSSRPLRTSGLLPAPAGMVPWPSP
ncbi:putative secreted protein (plasmid) [Streptomyces glaucescens]|uniref:Putative secreted protein n=1 Tax=Streptomyces glaucescens TaxID=1907 RepID=A0A089XER1_STRGA|nr:putative secreted protein [Streptomyces glaucescens]